MNKDEIKKALECCRNGCPIGDCPYYGINDCENNLFKGTIELITEQEKEIEQLKVENKQAKIDVLNELKEKCKFDGHTVAVYKNDIEEMIRELKK